MASDLDLRSIIFVVSFVALVFFFCMFYVSRTRKVYPGFDYWTAATFLYFIGFILVGLRDHIPLFFSVIIANVCNISLSLLIPYGIAQFAGKKQPLWPYMAVLGIFVALFCYFTYITPNISMRIVILSITSSILSIYAIALFRTTIIPVLKRSNLLLQLALFIAAISSLVRAAYTLIVEKDINHLFTAAPIHAVSMIVFCGCFVTACFSLFILNFQRLEMELSIASAELKTVKGFIPICAHCKKIRDDRGYWDQVEAYLASHSDMEFSHSICPECLEKFYPETPEED